MEIHFLQEFFHKNSSLSIYMEKYCKPRRFTSMSLEEAWSLCTFRKRACNVSGRQQLPHCVPNTVETGNKHPC